MLEVIDLELKYGSYSKSLNFKLEPGTLSWLRGKNGAGKSTLLLTLMGFEDARLGKVIWYGQSNSFAYAQQKPDFAFALSVQRVLQLAGVDRDSELIKKLGLQQLLDSSVTSLSGGEAQRILLAIAFNSSAPYLLLDEPFASQDVEYVAVIKELLTEQKQKGRAVLIASHIAIEADQIIELI